MKKKILKPNTVAIPAGLTARQIYDDCSNRTDFGKELLYGTWFKDQKFWDTESTRAMTVTVPSEICYAGKSYDELKSELGGSCIPTVAEVLWMLKTSDAFYDLLYWKNDVCWTWTSTRTDDGYLAGLGDCGFWDSYGPCSSRNLAGYSFSSLGLGFSCTASGTDETTGNDDKEAGQADARMDDIEKRLKRVESLFSSELLG